MEVKQVIMQTSKCSNRSQYIYHMNINLRLQVFNIHVIIVIQLSILLYEYPINVNVRLWIKISVAYRKSWLAFALTQYFCRCILSNSNPRQDTLAAILQLDIWLKTVYDHKKQPESRLYYIITFCYTRISHCKPPLTLKKAAHILII